MSKKVYTLRKYVSGSVYDLENLAKKQINCVAPKLFNDPIDTYYYYSDSSCLSESKKILTPQIMDTIRICCFIDHKDILEKRNNNKLTSNELLMWTHYADSHNGLCFEYEVLSEDFGYLDRAPYDKNKSFLGKIKYQEDLATDFESMFSPSEDESYSLETYEELLQTCFFTKDTSFDYEKEIRLLKYTDVLDNYLPVEFDYLKKLFLENVVIGI